MDGKQRPDQPAGGQSRLDALGTPLIATTFVVLDLETTGLSPATDRITEVGAVKVRAGEVLGELRTFVHPGRPIPPAVTALTGITDAMVRDAPTMAAVLAALMTFLGDAVFVGHNASFDLAFLRAAAAAHGYGTLDPTVVDTARLARRLLREEIRDVRLATVARHLRTVTRPEHRALADARATVDVLHGLIERAGAYGATTLEDLRDLTRSSSDQTFRRIALVRDAPAATGVYRFLDGRGEVLYVGKATDLRSRLRTYFGADRRRRIADLIRETDRVEWTVTATLLEAEVREVRAIHHHRPRYNRRSRRPAAAVHVALTREPFPRLSIVRVAGRTHLKTVGPLPSRRVAEQLIEAVHAVVPLRTCSGRLRRSQDHAACVLKDLGRCGAPCDGTQQPDSYAEVVAAALAVLDDPARLLRPLRHRMLELARHGRFERAGEVRARLHAAARALTSVRRYEALTGVDEIVAARFDGVVTEVAVIRNGWLAESSCLPGAADDRAILGQVTPVVPLQLSVGDTLVDGVGHHQRADPEELALVSAWLDRPGTRVVDVRGHYAMRIAGGRDLSDTVDESRKVGRALRRDRQLLAGAKVTRRAAATATAPVTHAVVT